MRHHGRDAAPARGGFWAPRARARGVTPFRCLPLPGRRAWPGAAVVSQFEFFGRDTAPTPKPMIAAITTKTRTYAPIPARPSVSVQYSAGYFWEALSRPYSAPIPAPINAARHRLLIAYCSPVREGLNFKLRHYRRCPGLDRRCTCAFNAARAGYGAAILSKLARCRPSKGPSQRSMRKVGRAVTWRTVG